MSATPSESGPVFRPNRSAEWTAPVVWPRPEAPLAEPVRVDSEPVPPPVFPPAAVPVAASPEPPVVPIVFGGPPRHLAPSAPGLAPPTPFVSPPPVATAPLYGGVAGVELPDYAAYVDKRRRAVGIIGLVVAIIGVALTVVSFTLLDWLTSTGSATVTFADLHKHYQGASPSATQLYFDWLGWALLAAVAVFALLAILPTRTHPLWRVLGLITGFAGVVLTFNAVYTDQNSVDDLLKHVGTGFWLAVAGFLLAGVGAVFGPRRAAI